MSAERWDPRAPEGVPFEVTVTVQALGSAWSDIAPSWSPNRGWPSLQDAAIRPGVKIIHQAGCTANFVYQNPSNTSLYIGTAAHCPEGWGIGTLMGIAGIAEAGRLVYCSWGTMETNATTGCVPPEESLVDTLDNDFAVVEIRPDLHHVVHPALDFLNDRTGLELGLSTWPLLQGITLPERAAEEQVEPLCDKGS